VLSVLPLRSFSRAPAAIAFALAAACQIPLHADAITTVSASTDFLHFSLDASSATSAWVAYSNPQDIWIVADDSNPTAPEQLVITLYFACPVYDDIHGLGGVGTGFGWFDCDTSFRAGEESQIKLPIVWGVPTELAFPLMAYASLATVHGDLVISAGAGTNWNQPVGDGTIAIVLPPNTSVPEPGTFGFAAIGVAILAIAFRKLRGL
jgi:hypothetical protein